MIKIDLITGFLGAGKTTFIKKYASYLMRQARRLEYWKMILARSMWICFFYRIWKGIIAVWK